jgi:dTDP-4-amino-4,6-dideoxygalactose transaminase
MKVPLLDLRAQLEYLEDDLLQAVTRVVQSTRYIHGPEVLALEKEIAAYCGVRFGVGVTSGTDALLISLMSLDIRPGDQIITTPYSFFATMGVILRLGAIPLFADIEPESFNINPEAVAHLLENDKKRKIRAILPVHLYGQCAEMGTLLQLAREYQLPVIEDAAQAIGSQYPLADQDGVVAMKRAGSMGLAGCFSFFPSKNLGSIGDAGMVVTDDEGFAEKLQLMRNHGAHPKYHHRMVGGNFRLDPIQAAALRVKMPYLEQWHEERAANAGYYNRLFEDNGLIDSGLVTLPEVIHREPEKAHIYNQYVLRVKDRDRLRDHLLAHDIGCEIYYPIPLHRQECLGEYADKAHCPEADKAAEETIALPIYPELTNEMQSFVVENIVQFYS